MISSLGELKVLRNRSEKTISFRNKKGRGRRFHCVTTLVSDEGCLSVSIEYVVLRHLDYAYL